MRSLSSSPGEDQEYLRKASGANREASGVAVSEVIETRRTVAEAESSLISGEREAKRTVYGVFEAFPEEQNAGCAEPVVGITAQGRSTVDVGTSKRRLKVKRDCVTGGNHRFAQQNAQIDGAFAVAGGGYRRARSADGHGTLVGSVELLWCTRPGGSIQRKLVREISGKASEGR